MKKVFTIFFTSLLLFSCDKDQAYEKDKAVSAFVSIDQNPIDQSLKEVAIALPEQKNSNFWSASPAKENQQIENFKFDFSIIEKGFFSKHEEISLSSSSKFFFFYLGSPKDHFVFSPIIKDDKAFILDTAGVLSVVDLQSKKRLWKSQIFKKSFLKNYQTPKIGYGNDKIAAIGGSNQIAVASAEDGKVLWSKDISSIPVSSPVIDENFVYVIGNNNKLYAFDLQNGDLKFIHSGVARNTAILGAANPLIYLDAIIVSYSSGEIYALNKKSGQVMWSQDLNLNKAVNSDFYLNDIDATPIAKDGVVYAIGNGGLMAAIDFISGNFLWRKKIAGITDFWKAGEFLYVINNDDKLMAIYEKTGAIKWISNLPDYEDSKKPQSKFSYSGIVMAGDKLLISKNAGELLIVSPFDGKIEQNFAIGRKIFHAPIIVDGKIYLNSIGKWSVDLIEVK